MVDRESPTMYYTAWCKSLFLSLAEGGVWGVPRSGLLFQKRGEKLILINRIPWEVGMEITKEQLAQNQERDYKDTQYHFGLAGITVEREDED